MITGFEAAGLPFLLLAVVEATAACEGEEVDAPDLLSALLDDAGGEVSLAFCRLSNSACEGEQKT
jgi:hypothetical protein